MTSRFVAPWLALLAAGCAQEHQCLSYEAAEQVCVALATCGAGPREVASCALGREYADADEPGVYRCVLAVGSDCDAVRACLGLSLTPVTA